MKNLFLPPGRDEIELTLLGPGYGESAVVHLGDDEWIVVDCLRELASEGGGPAPLRYLELLGVDAAAKVRFVLATHWHDDHIRGMAELVRRCESATFCCSAALCEREFLAIVGALGHRGVSVTGSGVEEIRALFSETDARRREYASANKRLLWLAGAEVWSLSPGTLVFDKFLQTVAALVPEIGRPKYRVPSLAPNEASVVLWVRAGAVRLLLGADLERQGWTAILENPARPDSEAAAFKLPHHGSEDADHDGVWDRMVASDAVSIVAPWSRGGSLLPRPADVRRILERGRPAYATATQTTIRSRARPRGRPVDRTIRESGIRVRRLPPSLSGVRIRRRVEGVSDWKVDLLGSGCRLDRFRK